MKQTHKLIAATCLLGMSIGAQANTLSSDLLSDVSAILISSIQESIQNLAHETRSNLQTSVKEQLKETVELLDVSEHQVISEIKEEK
ncbi:hypothetical protein PALB_32740 [Pseudoalteromonas luteoviolacea B = ATCC 29581]|nr:hypothetical protein PALB_32740 [Pseudoalteromonas luteoviolacea B = ATCC 29581]